MHEIALDGAVLGFTLLASILTGIIFSLAPAARFSKPDLNQDLKPSGGKMTLSLSRFSMGSLLVVAEVALALGLLLGAGLLLNSLVRLQRVDPGFDARNVADDATLSAAAAIFHGGPDGEFSPPNAGTHRSAARR